MAVNEPPVAGAANEGCARALAEALGVPRAAVALDPASRGRRKRVRIEGNAEEIAWFERFMEEQDADIIGWALGTIPVPDEWKGPMMDSFLKLDFVKIV